MKAQKLWAPNLPREWGGMGIGYIGQALVNEVIGRSVIGPRLFGNAAPDAGNAELLLIAATPEQKEQYLRPLAAGDEVHRQVVAQRILETLEREA